MNGGGFGASSAGSFQGVGSGIGEVDGAGEFVGSIASIEIPFAGQFVSGQASAGSGGDGGEAAKS